MSQDSKTPHGNNEPRDPDATIVESGQPTAADATILDPDRTVVESDQVSSSDEATPAVAAKHPGQIGHFTIIDTLGEGGMGAVYLAEQSEPVKRRVALKLVHASLRSPEALARFTAERQAMARLSHPSIAALFEAGATDDGFPYFAMENVPGETLTAYCDTHRSTIKERLLLFCQVCAGVQHAHQKGIMHRDLKPSNLLVAEVEGEAIPKIIDFGIAKALDEPLTAAAELTGLRAIGTPDYMSPEALSGSPDLDTRTDVYSLGVVLYELLTSSKPHTPVKAATSMRASNEWIPAIRPSTRLTKLDTATLDSIADGRQLNLQQLITDISGDLDWIVMKAIAEEPSLRYESAAEFAADITRYLAFEPVLARPPSTRYRVGKFVRRHRAAVAGAALVTLALILGIIGTTIGLFRAQQAEAEAQLETQRAEQVAGFMTGLFEVSDPGEARGNSITARELLDRGAKRIGTELEDQPLLRARLMGTMGDVYGKLGLYDQAVALEEDTLRLRESELGSNDPEVATSLNALGNLYRKQARFELAEKTITRALAIRKAVFGQQHPAYAESLNHLAEVEYIMGRPDEAEIHYRQAISIFQRGAEENPASLANSLHHLGWLLGNQGQFDEAETVLLQALDLRQKVLGADHYNVAETMALLAEFYRNSGRYEEAENLMLSALEIEQKVLDPGHTLIAESLFSLGVLFRIEGKLNDAEDYLRRARASFEASLGPEHANVARVLGELAMTVVLLERWKEAELIYRRQLQVYEHNFGTEHTLVGETLNNLGWVLSDGLQRYGDGEEVLRRAVSIFEAGDPDDYWNALSRWSLANNLRDQGLNADAEPYFEQAVGILERIGGANRADNPDLGQLVADYAKSLRAAGREADAVALEAGKAETKG
jgi:serine/threonine protein kinase/tetratricopeptide (TPR) repeat protein